MINKRIQLEKNLHKINIMVDLIKNLLEYNNIDGYDNKKHFNINLNYKNYDNKFHYAINISRGTYEIKDIFNTRFIYDKNIIKYIISIIKPLLERKELLYTAFQKDSSSNNLIKYCIIFKNGIEFKIDINDEEDLRLFKELNDKIKKDKIILEKDDDININKDSIQNEKSIKISDIALKIFKNFEEYNNLEQYNNIKPYKFTIEKLYDEKNNCYLLYFSIIRGTHNPEVIFKIKTCTKDEKLIYTIIYNFIEYYRNNSEYIYESINEKEKYYSILLNEQISIQYNYKNLKDKLFYLNIFKNKEKKVLRKTIEQKKL